MGLGLIYLRSVSMETHCREKVLLKCSVLCLIFVLCYVMLCYVMLCYLFIYIYLFYQRVQSSIAGLNPWSSAYDKKNKLIDFQM